MASKTERREIPEQQEYFTPIQFSILEKLREKGPMIRRELVKELKIPRTTIYDNLFKLQKRKLVEKYSKNDGKRGAPLIFWKLKEGP